MKKVLIIDNYDSFTYNLVHAVEEIINGPVDVWRNDQIDYEAIQTYDYIILSPGPGIPDEAGDLKKVISMYAGKIKMLGVCLGHQAIGEVFGAELDNLEEVYHGVQTPINHHTNCSLFAGIPVSFDGGRYHSWVIRKDSLNKLFEITATDELGAIMGMKHTSEHIYGVQYHPESILTPSGSTLLANFLNIN
jgi:glutamine amidotransferase of anthranilate synthase or aminodeoxychorismate synthase